MNKFEISKAELYFIQFLFCESRALLGIEYRGLYDAMFDRYKDVYEAGKKAGVDLQDINDKFKAIL